MEKTGSSTRIRVQQSAAMCVMLLLGTCLLFASLCIPGVTASVPDITRNFADERGSPTTAPLAACISTGQFKPIRPVLIHPVGWHMAGDSFAITGTTSLPADHAIMVNVLCGHSLTLKAPVADCNGISGEAVITSDLSEGTARWVYEVNTSGFQPDHYIVTVVADVNGSFAENSGDFFLLSPETSLTPERLSVKIDPIPSFSTSEAVRFSGTTTDPAGEYLIISVIPGVFLPGGTWQTHTDTAREKKTTRVEVIAGKNGENVWSSGFDPGSLEHGDYLIEAHSIQGDRKGYGFFTVWLDPEIPCSLQPITATQPQTTHAASAPAMLVIVTVGCYIGFRAYNRKKEQ